MAFRIGQTLSSLLIDWLGKDFDITESPLCDFERIRTELQPGDVLLVETHTRVSHLVRLITQSTWSHAALYVGRLQDIDDSLLKQTISERYLCEPDTQLLIESVLGQGIVVTPLSFYQREHLRVCRPRGISAKDAKEVIYYAASKLGHGQDQHTILDLLRLSLPWFFLPKSIRNYFFEKTAGRVTRLILSTMIAEAFGFIQFPILPLVKQTRGDGIQLYRRNPILCAPKDFDQSPYFEILKFPFVDYSTHDSYDLLPWRGSGIPGEELGQIEYKTHTSLQDEYKQKELLTNDLKNNEN